MAGAFDYSSSNPDLLPFVNRFLGGGRTALPDAWAAADEFALAKRNPARTHAIPFLLIQGLADLNSPPPDSRALQAALIAAGYHSRLVEIPGMDHLGTWANGDAVDAVMTIVTGNET
jgi:pimeloyl-ACP methyl ester carboxylesterase